MSDRSGTSINRKMADGAARMVSLRISELAVELASLFVLARILFPEDFGLVALATSTIAMIELFGQAGLDLALIQRRDTGRDQYDTAWTINVLI